LAAALLALVLVTGCTSEPPVTRSSAAPSALVPTASGRAPDSDGLAARRRRQDRRLPGLGPRGRAGAGGLPDAVLPCLGGGRDVRLAGCAAGR
jgi:hypothetical protein